MTDVTEERIGAYVDGELGPLEALRFERAMEADPALAAAVGRHRDLRDAIADRFAGVAAEPVPDRLRMLLDRDEKILAFPARRPVTGWKAGRYAALAATLVAGLMLGQLLPRGASDRIEVENGRVVAGGALGRALDTQLASTQAADAAYRIGVSFRAGDGRYCRSFDGAEGAGLGCRSGAGWTLERFVAGAARDQRDYRQAASPSAEILAAAQQMMAGEPLDATAERQARDKGWAVAR